MCRPRSGMCRCWITRVCSSTRMSASPSSAGTATGKSTLLRMLAGELTPDAGAVWRAPGLRAARLVQDASRLEHALRLRRRRRRSGRLRDLVTAYHHAADRRRGAGTGRGAPTPLAGCSTSSRSATAGASNSGSSWSCPVCSSIPTCRSTRSRAAGAGARCSRRRSSPSRTAAPADEPTNHLDIEAIEWLETFLADYAGAVVFVTHDRAFLERLATRVVELDRGRLTSWPGNYATFMKRKRPGSRARRSRTRSSTSASRRKKPGSGAA